ncbi:MAG: SprT family zinc-dependent metalloprotease [Pseudomonadota bacterium]
MKEILLDDPACRVRVNVNRRARRFTLRLSADGDAVVTVPPRVPSAETREFVLRHADWLKNALQNQPSKVVMEDGARLPVDGILRSIRVEPGRRRAPSLDGDALVISGNGPIGPRVAALLKVRARDRLQPAARAYARKLGRRINAISLRDTTTRWGSCSSRGNLSFSWRLAMAPVEVQDYVAAHEAAHLVEMNHSDRYWATLAGIMPDYEKHRRWLKREGRGLHAYRFAGEA